MKKFIFFFALVNTYCLAKGQPEPAWLISGNSGTNPSFHFLGTSDNKPLRFRVNNVYAGEIDSITTKTFFGYGAGSHVTTGQNNTAVGFKSLYANTSGYYNTAIGKSALTQNTTGYYNTACGGDALIFNTTGTKNTASGVSALAYNSSGYNNTANGVTALYSNTTGYNNTAIGTEALYYNTTGTFNTAVGKEALLTNKTGGLNTAVGFEALVSNTGGGHNVGVGYMALYYNNNAVGNTAVGSGALYYNTEGIYNSAFGYASLNNTSNAFFNSAIGYSAGRWYNLGWNNTFVGTYSDANLTGIFNCIGLGESSTCTASSQARIGNSSTSSIGGYVGWSNISDGRYKKDINEDVKGLDFIMQLRPVTYHLDVSGLSKKLDEGRGKELDKYSLQAISEKEKMVYTGFIAQEVEQVAKKINYDFSGIDKPKNENDLYGLRYAEFVVPLVKAVQEQQEQINELKKEIELLKEQNKLLRAVASH